MDKSKDGDNGINYFTQPPFEVQKRVTVNMNKLEKYSYILAVVSTIISVFLALGVTFGGEAYHFLDIFGYSIYILLPTTLFTIGLSFYEFFSIKRLKNLNKDKRITVYGVRFSLLIAGLIIGFLISLCLYGLVDINTPTQNTSNCELNYGCLLAPVFVGLLYNIIATIASFIVVVNTTYLLSCFIADKIYVYFLNQNLLIYRLSRQNR